MPRKIASSLTVLLLASCQATPPTLAPSTPTELRLQARGAADSVDKLATSPQDHLDALASLTDQGYTLGFNPASLANATFTLDVVPFTGDEQKLNGVLFSDYLAALAETQRDGITSAVPSINVVDGITKQVNDGVYARLEMLWEDEHMGPVRQQLLAAVQAAWTAHPNDPQWQNMLANIVVAARLAGQTPTVPDALKAGVDQAQAAFEADVTRSKPLGFYTLNDNLKQIYRSDRMLQTLAYMDSTDGGINDANVREAVLAGGLVAGNDGLAKALDLTGSFYQLMANPFNAFTPTALGTLKPADLSWDDLASQADKRLRFWNAAGPATKTGMFKAYAWMPPSSSVEDALFANAPPEETDLMDYLIRQVQSGAVSLAPQANSGFYQYQEYALQALLTPDKDPEGSKIQFGDAYLKRLVEAFKTGLTKARETQVKSTCWNCAEPTSVAPPPATPRMFVEPIPTVYLRYGNMYDFLEKQVLPLFPADALDTAHPLEEGGDPGVSVRARVAFAKQLMFGLYLVATDELGLQPEKLPLDATAQKAALAAAKLWLAGYQKDPLITYDTRVVVPIHESTDSDPLVTYWGTAGVTMSKVEFNFNHLPDGSYDSAPADYFVAADKFISFKRPLSKGLLDRQDYRAILDGSASLSEALTRLAGS